MPEPTTILTITANLLGEIGKGILGNRSDYFFCQSVKKIYRKLYNQIEQPSNHDVLKAVRKAQINSTLMACRYIAKSKYKLWDNLFSMAPKKLRGVSQYLKKELNKIEAEDYIFDVNLLNENPILLINPNGSDISERLPEIKLSQKQIIVDELKKVNLFRIETDLQDAIIMGWDEGEKKN